RRERELACDAAVLRHLGRDESAHYGRALLKVAEQASALTPLPGGAGVFARDRSLVRRIHMIANYRKPTAAGKALGALLLLMLAAFGLTDAVAQPDTKTGTTKGTPAVKRPDARTVAIAGICLDDDNKALPGVQVVLYRQ